MTQDAGSPQVRTGGMLDRSTAAWLALVFGVLLTLVLWRYVGEHLEDRTRDRFANHAALARDNLLSRMQAYEQVLHGGAALFAASDAVSRAEWGEYVAALHLERSLPGIQGTGFTAMFPASALAAHVAEVRSQGFPDYDVHPPGSRAQYSSIVFLEPFDARNRRAFGYDMYSEPVRREAMERARDTGRAALSGRVILVQEFGTEVQPGFLMYLPVYAKDRPLTTVEERRAALLGFVYAPFRALDMMQAIFRDDLRDAHIELHDLHESLQTLLYASAGHDRTARYAASHEVEVAGRKWMASFGSTPAFEADHASAEPALILYGGSALSVMLFAVMHSNARHRRRMRAAALHLARSRDEFRTLVENVPGVVFRCQIEVPWKVMHISRGITLLTGATPDEFMSGRVTFGDFILQEDVPAIVAAIENACACHANYEVEYRMRGRDGRIRWVSERGRVAVDVDDKPLRLDGVIIDVTERKTAEEAIRNLAFVDTLTQLPNRRFLLDRLRQGLANARRHGRHGALLFIDIDHFKRVNDTYGHEAGDQLLCEIAARLRKAVREGDTVARLGGDEFVVMLEDLGEAAPEAADKATLIADKILTDLNAPYDLGTVRHRSTPSIGIACFDGGEERAEDLLRRADEAMYRAKAGGRNRLETQLAS